MTHFAERLQTEHVALRSGEEFDVIRELLDRWGPLADGVGDDAALYTPPEGEQLVLSVDASLEGVHFREAWLSPEEIGARAAAAALSDIAAMGAQAQAMLVALELPEVWLTRVGGIADGIGAVLREANARILGGNLTRGNALGLTLTVIGSVVRPVRRVGALPGDALWVTGRLGGPGRAVAALLRGDVPDSIDRERLAAPLPRLREGAWLAAVGAHAMMDVSDGLAADAAHLAAASGVECVLWSDRIPCFGEASVEEALNSGEEYELLVATAPDLDADGFERRFGVPLTHVGIVRAMDETHGPRVVLATSEDTSGPTRVALPAGYDHFS